jgi:hypothetical protein
MSFAIKYGGSDPDEGGLIYMDAVVSYSQNFSGQVTKHPVDGGAQISDHFISQNPVFTMSAVISGVDISTGSYLIQDNDGNFPYNVTTAPTAVSVNSTDSSVLSRFIPDSIGQFLPDSSPDVVVDPARSDLIEQLRDMLKDLISGVKFNDTTGQFDPNIQVVQLYEFTGRLLKRIQNNLVVTSIQFKEDANTGYGLYCDITFEQVSFVYLKKTDLPKDVQTPVKSKAATKKSIGKCDSKVRDASDPNNTDSQENKDSVNGSVVDVDPRRNVTPVGVLPLGG